MAPGMIVPNKPPSVLSFDRGCHAAEREKRDEPIDREQHDDRVKLVVRQRLVEALRPPDVGERRGGENQHGREPDDDRLPLIVDRGEAPARAERLPDPAKHAALIGKRGGQFGGDSETGTRNTTAAKT